MSAWRPGAREDEASFAARRDLGNEAKLREDVRALWTWRPLDELSQDLRFAFRTMFKHRAVAMFAIAVARARHRRQHRDLQLHGRDPAAVAAGGDPELAGRDDVAQPSRSPTAEACDQRPSSCCTRLTGALTLFGTRLRPDLSVPAFERLAGGLSAGVLSSIFVWFPAGRLTVHGRRRSRADASASTSRVIFFGGIAVSPAAGRLLHPDDDRAGAPPVAVISDGYAERRFGSLASAIGRQILINNLPFTVVGVTPTEFDGIDPGVAPQVYLPMQAMIAPRHGRRRRCLRIRTTTGPASWGACATVRHSHRPKRRSRRRSRSGWHRPQATTVSAPIFRYCRSTTARGGLDTLRRKVCEAALSAAGHGRSDPCDRVREHRQPAARAGDGPPARDRGEAQHRRRTLPADPPVAD